MQHDLKIKQCYLFHILQGRKTFDVRKNDRDFQVGDRINFLPIDDNLGYDVYGLSSPLPKFVIKYIHYGLGMKDGYIALAIQELKDDTISR